MKLTKNNTLFLASVFIIMAVYNVVVFILPFSKGGWFWTGYGFSMFAFVLTAAVGLYAFGREKLQSKFYRIPLVSVARRYLIVQLIVGILEMIFQHNQYLVGILEMVFQNNPYLVGFLKMVSQNSQYFQFQYGIALNAILLGACLIGLIAVDAAREEIERIDEKIKEKVFYIKSLQVDIECLVDKTLDESVKKILKNLAETIKYSDPMSSPQLASIENKIETKVAILTETVDANDIKALCNELQQLFAERNRKCKILK
jgi:hypothetical protein